MQELPSQRATIAYAWSQSPVESSSNDLRGSGPTRDEVEKRLIEEIADCTYLNVANFIPNYFHGKTWEGEIGLIENAIKEQKEQDKWHGFPEKPDEGQVTQWFFDFQETFLSQARGQYFMSETEQMVDSESKRQVDLLVKLRGAANANHTRENNEVVHPWEDVKAIGQLMEKEPLENLDQETILQLAGLAREVFISQPTRPFVHAFTLCGPRFQAWVFDRSGPYASSQLDLRKEEDLGVFVRIISAYVMMDDIEWGLDTFIKSDNRERYVEIIELATTTPKRFYLEPNPIACQHALVCRGTCCFRAHLDSPQGSFYVVKFSWTSDKRQSEASLLAIAKESGVEGIATLFGDKEVMRIRDLRRGMEFKNAVLRDFRSFNTGSQDSWDPLGSKAQSQTNSKKRKFGDLEQEQQQTLVPEDSLCAKNSDAYDNRIFRCLVISPAGRPLCDFESPMELLKALRDAIKGHRSLFIKGNILHRDISENNIIITDPTQAGCYTGLLIDMDLAELFESGRSGARFRTGTLTFMAIGVLQGAAHTYRTDLESFFYVLLWLCARRSWENGKIAHIEPKELKAKKESSRLHKWYTGTYDDIATMKLGHMSGMIENVLGEFPQSFHFVRDLCRIFHSTLFFPEGKGPFLGALEEKEQVYDIIIQAFDETIGTQEDVERNSL
ncbi:hypothetical protein BDR22DRAFT_882293 [Usnea florida]